MENKTNDFVSKLDFERVTNSMRIESNNKIQAVDDKIDNVKEMILPLLESSRHTADNTKRTAELMEQFTREQRATNGKFYSKFNEHDVLFANVKGQFAEVGVKLDAKTEAKKSNTALWVGLLATIGGIITAIFEFAPTLFK